MPKPYSQEFRDDVVAVARKGEALLTEIAKDCGTFEGCLHGWLKKGGVEAGNRLGVTVKHAEEASPSSVVGGFGLDCLAYTLVCSHGTGSAQWPMPVLV